MIIDWWTWHDTGHLRALLTILYSFLDICWLIYPNIHQKARPLDCAGLYTKLRYQVLSLWVGRSDLSGDFARRRTAGHDGFLLFGFFLNLFLFIIGERKFLACEVSKILEIWLIWFVMVRATNIARWAISGWLSAQQNINIKKNSLYKSVRVPKSTRCESISLAYHPFFE